MAVFKIIILVLLLISFFLSNEFYIWINPILTGGGGSIWPPPARNPRLPRDRRRSRHAFSWLISFKSCASFDTKFAKIGPSVARSRDVLYSDLFLSSLAHLLIPSLRKSDRRSRGHVTFCTRTSAQNLPKICILHRFVYKTHRNYWIS